MKKLIKVHNNHLNLNHKFTTINLLKRHCKIQSTLQISSFLHYSRIQRAILPCIQKASSTRESRKSQLTFTPVIEPATSNQQQPIFTKYNTIQSTVESKSPLPIRNQATFHQTSPRDPESDASFEDEPSSPAGNEITMHPRPVGSCMQIESYLAETRGRCERADKQYTSAPIGKIRKSSREAPAVFPALVPTTVVDQPLPPLPPPAPFSGR